MKIVYIDTQNVHKSIQNLGWTIDWWLFYLYLQEKFSPDCIKMFMGYIPQLEHLYTQMKTIGYTVIFKQTAKREDWTIKGNIDIDLTMHVMEDMLVWGLISAYIVSGDGDYNTLVARLNTEKKLWRLLVPNINKTTSQLRHASWSNIQSLVDLRHLVSKKESSS